MRICAHVSFSACGCFYGARMEHCCCPAQSLSQVAQYSAVSRTWALHRLSNHGLLRSSKNEGRSGRTSPEDKDVGKGTSARLDRACKLAQVGCFVVLKAAEANCNSSRARASLARKKVGENGLIGTFVHGPANTHENVEDLRQTS